MTLTLAPPSTARSGVRKLQQAQFGPIGSLAQKFSVQRDGRGERQALGEPFQARQVGDHHRGD
jgi:hypothetical protein